MKALFGAAGQLNGKTGCSSADHHLSPGAGAGRIFCWMRHNIVQSLAGQAALCYDDAALVRVFVWVTGGFERIYRRFCL